MLFRALDENGDWVFGKGKNDYYRGIEALRADLSTRLNSWKFDCFFDEEAGIDYTNFLDRNTKLFLDNDIKREILQTVGVLRINSFSSIIDEDSREYQATINILSIYGNLEFLFVERQER